MRGARYDKKKQGMVKWLKCGKEGGDFGVE